MLARQAELDAVPIEPGGAMALTGRDRRLTEVTDMPRHFREIVVREHRDMAEQIVEAVRRFEVVELFALADEIAHRKDALAEHCEEDFVRDEAGHRDRAPAGPRPEDRVERRDPGTA